MEKEQKEDKETKVLDPEKEAKKKARELEKQKKLDKLKEKQNKREQMEKEKKEKPKKEKKEKKEEKEKEEEQKFDSLDEAISYKQNIKNLRDVYDSKEVESYWYQWWEQNKFFSCDEQKGQTMDQNNKFTMVIPPPNVTGQLHIGHGLTGAIEDTIVRRKRMQGYLTCYVPGMDHAGIATQSVVEKQLWKTEQKTKHDIGREKMLEHIWSWKEKNGNQILEQFKRLGMSLDWDRFSFTMDDQLSKAVSESFVRLYEQGLIYRENRLVNWSSKMQTAISDIEVDYQDINKKTYLNVPNHDQNKKYPFGYLIKFAYKVEGSDDEIVVATTRLETMLGDVAVAVNSKDSRYQQLIGKQLVHPFIENRKVVVISDDILVDMEYGTGAVKITPGHDPNDFECGLRHKLQQINILTDDGRINHNGGKYQNMMRFDVRLQMEQDLKQMGLYRGQEDNVMRLGFCSRSKDIIEPMLKQQWYLNCQTVKQRMLDCVKTKELEILPSEFEKTWFFWIENIKDWCISRQIWWGHRCPAYQITIRDQKVDGEWLVGRNIHEISQQIEQKYNMKVEDQQTNQDNGNLIIKQDEDVLDTWFSSALFPFSPFGWPDTQNPNFKSFYPNSLLETGHDILFFWVARMVMMGYLLTDQLPFKTVFLHPIVRDAEGKKMSKTLGNVIDPLEVIDGCDLQTIIHKLKNGNLDPKEVQRCINEKTRDFPNGMPRCGSDALRFGLLSYMIQPRNINLDIKRVQGYKQFCNKIWNSSRYVIQNFENFQYDHQVIDQQYESLSTLNKWILNQLNIAIKKCNDCQDVYDFGNTTIAFHNYWIYDFCDIYIEATKSVFYGQDDVDLKTQTLNVLFYCLQTGLRLLHPMMPFLTEELYQKLPQFSTKSKSICIAEYPSFNPKFQNSNCVQQIDFLFNCIKSVRQATSALNLPNNVRPQIMIQSKNDQEQSILKNEYPILKELAKIGQIVELDPKQCVVSICSSDTQIYLDVKQFIKVEDEILRLESRLTQNEKLVEDLIKKMSVKDYDTKVPQTVKDQNEQKHNNYLNEQKKLQEALQIMNKLKGE